MPSDIIIPVSNPAEAAAGRTGLWRVFKPVIDKSKCVKCWVCALYCMEDVIDEGPDGYPVIDYEFCKGCGICANECPTKAIDMVPEVRE